MKWASPLLFSSIRPSYSFAMSGGGHGGGHGGGSMGGSSGDMGTGFMDAPGAGTPQGHQDHN